MISSNSNISNRIRGAFLVGTMLGGFATPLYAQAEAAPVAPAVPTPAVAPAGPTSGTIRSIQIKGAERLEPETVRAYSNLVPGQEYTAEKLDAALKDLYATELFTDVVISGADSGALVITVKENPVINRIVLEGNKRIKSDKITPEIRLAPRQIFTRSKVRSDVERIIELYKRQGRFAATVDPKIVELDQNRVDLVFEIHEGDKSKVRAINVIGNNTFSDDRLQKEMYTKKSGGVLGFFKSNDSYDPDRLAADQQKLRAFYLTQGYADFRVVSALAELTPDRKDFVITYVVEEGPRYKFGTIDSESALRDLDEKEIKTLIPIKTGEWFNAKQVEDVVASLTEVAGNRGYAFADINPNYTRNTEKHIMDISFRVGESPRVYIERIDITGNTQTRDKVIRREFRVRKAMRSAQSASSAARTACRASAFSRTSWRSSRPKVRPQTGSCSAPTSRKNRPASCSSRRAIRASKSSSSMRRSLRTISWARVRSPRLASIIPNIRGRRTSVSPSLIYSTKMSRLAVRSSGAISIRTTIMATADATRPIRRSRRVPPFAPASR